MPTRRERKVYIDISSAGKPIVAFWPSAEIQIALPDADASREPDNRRSQPFL